MRRYADPSVLLAYAAFVLVGLGSGVGGVLLLAQIGDYGVDRATIGITFFTGSAGYVLAGASTGALVHRLGLRGTLVIGAGGYVLVGLYTATRPPFVAFVVVQLAAGYATGLLESVLNVYVTGLPDATGRLNRLHAFFGVGALLGPLLATWIVGFARWTVVWLVLAVVAIPLVIGFQLVYPRSDPAPDPASDPAPDPDPEPVVGDRAGPGPRGLLRAALRQPAVRLGALLLTVYVGLEISMGNWGFSYLVQARGQVESLAGYSISGYWLGLTLGRFLISPVATRMGASAVGLMYGCLAGVTVAVTLLWLVPGAGAASAGFGLLGFFLGPIFPTTMAVAPRLAPARLVPTAIGVINAGSLIGGSALPWLAGALGQGVGVWTLPPFALILAVLQLAVWWPIARHLRAGQTVAS